MNLFSLKLAGVKKNLGKLSADIDGISAHKELSEANGKKAVKVLDCIIDIQGAMSTLESKISQVSNVLNGTEPEEIEVVKKTKRKK